MRSHWRALPFLIPALAAAFVGAAPSAQDTVELAARSGTVVHELIPRDGGHEHGHGHNHHVQPLLELNETEVLLYHQPTPPSYWTIDLVDHDPEHSRYPSLMGLHIIFMSLAFFGALPIGKFSWLVDYNRGLRR